jgi:hypothetical protein
MLSKHHRSTQKMLHPHEGHFWATFSVFPDNFELKKIRKVDFPHFRVFRTFSNLTNLKQRSTKPW